MTNLSAVACDLETVIDKLPSGKVDFAKSLIKQQKTGKKLSDKQSYWLAKLLEMANEQKPAGPTQLDLSVSLLPIITMFDAVSAKLKSPALWLEVSGQPICLYPSKGGKYPGTIQVTDGGSYGNNKWFGRVNKDGTFFAGYAAEDVSILEDFLEYFAHSPATVAAKYGKKTGRCCFCNKHLTDQRSTHVGYGETCSKNWGLPYPKLSEVNALGQTAEELN